MSNFSFFFCENRARQDPRLSIRNKYHWEIRGRFRKRVVLANVPSFRFSFWGTCERTLVPVCVPGEHPNVPSFPFSFQGNIRQNHSFGNHLFVNPGKYAEDQRLRNQIKTPRLVQRIVHVMRRCRLSCCTHRTKYKNAICVAPIHCSM